VISLTRFWSRAVKQEAGRGEMARARVGGGATIDPARKQRTP
jgi:hypothetical protein